MIAAFFDSPTLTGIGVLIAAVASLVTAVSGFLNGRAIRKVKEDTDILKKNGNGGGMGDDNDDWLWFTFAVLLGFILGLGLAGIVSWLIIVRLTGGS